jgi:Flp pilus assembly protein TadG
MAFRSIPAARRRRQSGAEILEAALVLPILFFIIFAMIWLGLAFNVSSTIHRAARQAVHTGASASCALCGNALPPDTQIVNSVTSALQAAHLRMAKVILYSPPFACQATPAPSCTTASNVQICRGVPMSCGTATCQSPPAACGDSAGQGTRVSFAYQFDSLLPVGAFRSITIRASAQSPGEN